MTSNAKTVDEYVATLPPDRKEAIQKLRALVFKNMPPGFEEVMQYGMPCYVIPHSTYPAGYHVDPSLPIGFLAIASQKNFIAFYHSGLYADPAGLKWFTESYPKHAKGKLDIGKSCVRFKKPAEIPYELLGELLSKYTVADYIKLYEENIKDSRKRK